MQEYNVDEFLDMGENAAPSTYSDEVEKKVSLLYDFAILGKMCGKRIVRTDKREEAVRQLLRSYGSQTLMDNAVRDILASNYKLDDALKRKGLLQ